jgi:hypothetical protein
MKEKTPETRVREFIAKFAPAHQRLIRAVRRTMRRKFPTAIEMVYDNYNFFVMGYSPNQRPSDAVFSIAAGANGVGLCFLRGKGLPDPARRLQGSGNQTRFLRLPTAAVLDEPEVRELMDAAVRKSRVPFSKSGRPSLIIRSVSKKQRPRRKD